MHFGNFFYFCSACFLPVLLQLLLASYSYSKFKERHKRFLIYPFGGGYKMVIGIGIPVMLPKLQMVTLASNVQFQYPQLTNLSEVQQGLPPIISRRRRAKNYKSDRALTYVALETIMDKYELNGKICLLRAICENAMHSVNHDANGLYGQLIDMILTPVVTVNNKTEMDVDYEYIEAMQAGQFGVDCLTLYSECPLGILEFISVLKDN